MPIVQAKCENCGGVLAVDESQKAAICPFCNTPYVVQDAINNYNITNNIKVEAGATVNVYNTNTFFDFEIEVGVLKKYKGEDLDVVIPNNVIKIGIGAFEKLQIKSVVIPEKVNEICDWAFRDCTSLKEVIIPNGVNRIGEGAFFGCTSMSKITIPDSVIDIGSDAFVNCRSLTSITIPEGVKEIKDFAFAGCSSLKHIVLPDSIERIGEGAFDECKILDNVILGKSVNDIGPGAFRECASLKAIDIPNGVTTIDYLTFWNCISLEDVIIPDSVEYISKNAFDGCPLNPDALVKVSSLIKQSKESQGGCYIATAVYGSYDCPQVWTLRRYRDYRLDATWYGRLFIMFYYAVSPTLVKWFGHTEWFKKMWKGKLDRMVEKLQREGYENTPYNDKY